MLLYPVPFQKTTGARRAVIGPSARKAVIDSLDEGADYEPRNLPFDSVAEGVRVRGGTGIQIFVAQPLKIPWT